MEVIKAAALVLTIKAALVGGPTDHGLGLSFGSLSLGSPPTSIMVPFGQRTTTHSGPQWRPRLEITGDKITWEKGSGVLVVTAPSQKSVKQLLGEAPETGQMDVPESLLPEHGSYLQLKLPIADAGRTAYLEQIEPGLYRRKELAEKSGATVGIRPSAPSQDMVSVAVELAYQELIGGKFEESIGAYTSRPSLSRKEVLATCSVKQGQPVLLYWDPPQVRQGGSLISMSGPGYVRGPRGEDVPVVTTQEFVVGRQGPPSGNSDLPSPLAVLLELSAKDTQTGKPVTQQGSAAPGPRAPLNLSLRGAPVRDVLTMIAEASGINVVVTKDVEGTVGSLDLHDVTPERALRMIAASAGLSISKDGDTYVIAKKPPEPLTTPDAAKAMRSLKDCLYLLPLPKAGTPEDADRAAENRALLEKIRRQLAVVDGVDFRLEPSPDGYTLGEPILLNFSAHNTRENAVRFGWNDFDREALVFSITDPENRDYRDIKQPERGGLYDLNTVRLPPGETYSEKIALSQWFAFGLAGQYDVEWTAPVHSRDLRRAEGEKPAADIKEGVARGAFRLIIKPRDEQRLNQLCRAWADELLQTRDYSARKSAALALGHVRDDVAVPYIAEVIEKRATRVPYATLLAGLRRIGTAQAEELLQKLTHHQSKELAGEAKNVLRVLHAEHKVLLPMD